jgi:hypothetical protein
VAYADVLNMITFADRAFRKAIQVNEAVRAGPNPV